MKIMDFDGGDTESFIRMEDILDQGNEMAQSRSSQCRCDFCCIEESPIVAADGLLFKCCLKGESYIPTEVVEFNELIRSLQKRVSAIETRRRTLSAPSTPTKHDRFSSRDRNNNNNKMSLFNFNRRSSSESYSPPPISKKWSERSRPRSGINRVASTPSFKTTPNSILIKYTEKQILANISPSDLLGGSYEENELKLRRKYAEQLTWFRENGRDFVALETMKTLTEVSALLFVLAEDKSPTLVQLRVSCNETITVSYQFLDNFKQEFMMLKVSEGYYMFMAPF